MQKQKWRRQGKGEGVLSSSSVANWLLTLGGLTSLDLGLLCKWQGQPFLMPGVSPVAQKKQCEHILGNYTGIIIIFLNTLSKSKLFFSSQHLLFPNSTSRIACFTLGYSLNHRLSEQIILSIRDYLASYLLHNIKDLPPNSKKV